VPLPQDNDIEKALNYLAENDRAYAQTKAAHTAKKEAVKVAEAFALLESTGANAAERTAKARTSAQYKLALEELETAEFEHELIRLRFKRAEVKIDVWRTISANIRRTT